MRYDLLAVSSSLADVREFISAVTFAHPGYLWLTFVPLVLSLIAWRVARRRQSRLAALGQATALGALRMNSRPQSRFVGAVAVLMWVMLSLGVAGPRWGRQSETGIAVGRDIVILLDFSRSMWAEDMASKSNPARWQAAVAGSREMIDTIRNRGGHRVAIVLFAARPYLLVPLTTDYDHLDFQLSELDATTPPAEIGPADDTAISGTRIGAAIRAGIQTHDPRFPGFQEIVLITDADDPANDRECQAGITAARTANIPVHVIGVGDPTAESFILHRGGPLESLEPNGVPVPIQTKLHEEVAEAIALESHGGYLSSRTETPKLGEFFRAKIESNATRDVSDERLPQPRDRSAWFLGAAAMLLMFLWRRD